MFIQAHRRWRLMLAILSLSLLTVVAGAAVAPALDVIQQHFSGEPVILIQLIISMPALFIAITNLFFGKLCTLFKGRTLTLTGLAFYVVFGCAAGLCPNIYLLLICRALVGVGVGIIMAGMDIAQFTAPTIIAAIQAGFGAVSGDGTSYQAALLLSVVMLLWVGVFDRKKD